jgi:hypothetical protein
MNPPKSWRDRSIRNAAVEAKHWLPRARKHVFQRGYRLGLESENQKLAASIFDLSRLLKQRRQRAWSHTLCSFRQTRQCFKRCVTTHKMCQQPGVQPIESTQAYRSDYMKRTTATLKRQRTVFSNQTYNEQGAVPTEHDLETLLRCLKQSDRSL